LKIAGPALKAAERVPKTVVLVLKATNRTLKVVE
jgi:hypothetical protein